MYLLINSKYFLTPSIPKLHFSTLLKKSYSLFTLLNNSLLSKTLANQDDVSLKPNAYVIKFCIVNKYSYDYYCNWYSFAKVEKLISFLKCVVIPSTYITKAFGKDENTIFLDAL